MNMKKQLLLLAMMLLPMVVSVNVLAYDIEVANDDGVIIYYNYFNDGTELSVTYRSSSYSGYSGNVVIPKEVVFNNRTRKVTNIGEWAFHNCRGLTSVTIPNSVTRMEHHAFEGCLGLKKVIVKDIAAWCRISFGVYANPLDFGHHLYSDENTEITHLVIPNGVTSIGNRAFFYCTGLSSVTFPNSVTGIGNEAFSYCTGLTTVNIPNSVTIIGGYAFNHCTGLTTVNIPNSVKSIEDFAFESCSGLTSVTFGNNVTSIGGYAFYHCSGLTSVTIPNSVTSIGYNAFNGCNLSTVISQIKTPFAITGKDSDFFSTFSRNTFNDATLYVPIGTIDKYKDTEGWKDFMHIEEGVTDGVAQVPANAVLIQNNGGQLTIQGVDDGTQVSVYSINGTEAGKAISTNGCASINTNLQAGSVAIIKIGEKSVKVVVK